MRLCSFHYFNKKEQIPTFFVIFVEMQKFIVWNGAIGMMILHYLCFALRHLVKLSFKLRVKIEFCTVNGFQNFNTILQSNALCTAHSTRKLYSMCISFHFELQLILNLCLQKISLFMRKMHLILCMVRNLMLFQLELTPNYYNLCG